MRVSHFLVFLSLLFIVSCQKKNQKERKRKKHKTQKESPTKPSNANRATKPLTTVLTKLPFHRYYREVVYEERDGVAYYQGDIELGPIETVKSTSMQLRSDVLDKKIINGLIQLRDKTKFKNIELMQEKEYVPPKFQVSAITLDPEYLWTGGVIAYEIKTKDFDRKSFRDTIELAMQIIEDNTAVKFVKRTNQNDYIKYIASSKKSKAAGSSPVGRQGGANKIRLKENEISLGSIMHEIMHSMGIYHTQSRSDRGEHICIQWKNIEEDYKGNFDKHNGETLVGVYGQYNINSFMHYSSCGFAKKECNAKNYVDVGSILAKDANGDCNIYISGNRTASNWPQSDIDMINYMYGPLNSDPDEIIPVNQAKTITVTVENLQTIKEPEENGVGCNKKMDYEGKIELGPLKDINKDPYTFSRCDVFSFSKIEGDNINPHWRGNVVLDGGDKYCYIKVTIYDDDKKGGLGIGKCGGDDDLVDVSPFTGLSSMHFVLDTETNEIHKSNTQAIWSGYNITGFNSTTNGVVGEIGDLIQVSGNTSNEHHVASMQVRIDME